ncbi:MAG: CoA transferase [Actinomycetota bacterium]|nr:CoA transferase [Actinomycetota bacterium]
MAGVLDGLKIVELGEGLSTAQVGQLFADFGAEVIAIEPPGGALGRREPGFMFLARGKKSIMLDLGLTADAEVARRLMSQADVVITQERSSILQECGLDGASIMPLNPSLIYTHITAFGTKGSLADVKADEAMVSAKVGINQGFAVVTDRPGPTWSSTPWASWSGSQAALQGIFAALRERTESGFGQQLDVSMAHALGGQDPFNQNNAALEMMFPGAFASGGEHYDSAGAPLLNFPFKLLVAITKDGYWLQFSGVQPRHFRDFMEASGLNWMYDDERWGEFVTVVTDTVTIPDSASSEMRLEFWGILHDAVKSKTLAEWHDLFAEYPNVFAEIFRRGTELLHHPQLEVEGQLTTICDPRHGDVLQPGPLVRFSDNPAHISSSSPLLNENEAELRSRVAMVELASFPISKAPATLPLEGLTILELGMFFAAPYGSTILTDLGARVIKLEVLEGDPMRTQQAFPEAGAMKVLQGKESVALNLGSPHAKAIVEKIAKDVDIVMCSFRAGAADRMGLGFEGIKAMNPRIMYLYCPGFGLLAPQGAAPAYAPVISAGAGISMRSVGFLIPEGVPDSNKRLREYAKKLQAGGATAAVQPDGVAAFAVGTALAMASYLQAIGLLGQELLTTMLMSCAHLQGEAMVEFEGRWPESSTDIEILGVSALQRLYETAAGWIAISVTTQREWESLAELLWIPNDDQRFMSGPLRHEHDDELVEMLSKLFLAHEAVEWEARALVAGVPLLEVNTERPELIFLGPIAEEHGWVTRIESPIVGEMPRLSPFQKFSRSKTQALPGNTVGQHTAKVMREIGYSDAEIAEFAERKVILLG